uniref:Uncharacterized protein n=1 Tax=Oryza punctata TaxID=4537 RepID=A0A0E0MBN3_ORYPU
MCADEPIVFVWSKQNVGSQGNGGPQERKEAAYGFSVQYCIHQEDHGAVELIGADLGGGAQARQHRLHAQALTLAVLGGAALAHHYYNHPSTKTNNSSSLDYDFYSQLPPANTDDGQENERWSW